MTGAWEEPRRRRAPRRALLVALLVAAGVVTAWTARAPRTLQIGDTRATPTTDDAAWAPPRRGLWIALPAAPVLSRIDHAIAGRGDRVVVWGGFDARGRPLHDGAVLDVGSGEWTRLPTAGAGGTSAEAVWVGDDVVAVSRTATRTFDAVRRIWRDGAPPPLGDAEVLEHVVATGDVVVARTRPAVAGSRRRPGALAWFRDTRRWRRLPDPPIAPADSGIVLATARRLVTLRPSSPEVPAVAAELDPSSPDAAWAAVAPPPTADRPLDRLLGAVVDDRVVLVGADQAGDAVHAAVRDRQGTWRPIALPPVAVTTDDDLLAVDGAVVLWDRRAGAGAVLDVAAGRWDRMPTSPAADGVPRPAVAAGPHLVTWGGLGPVGAVLRVP